MKAKCQEYGVARKGGASALNVSEARFQCVRKMLESLTLEKSFPPYSLCSQINKYNLYIGHLYTQISILDIAFLAQREYQKS